MKYLKFFYVICFISLIFIIVDRHSRGKAVISAYLESNN